MCLASKRYSIAFGWSVVSFYASQGSLMAKVGTNSRPLAKITLRDCLAMRSALRSFLHSQGWLMVVFARDATFWRTQP